MSQSAAYLLEPHWHRRDHLRRRLVPRAMQTWLYNDASLTARLVAGCPAGFRVEVLRQRYSRIQRNEACALGVPCRQRALLREVYLYCGEQRVVYARSVIPLSTLTGRQKRLAYLGSKPLGGFLFACPSMRREAVQVAQLRQGNEVFERAMAKTTRSASAIWGRRSVFRLSDKPLLVAEIFLPDIASVKS